MKEVLQEHTQDGVDVDNINRSKFKQVLRWLGIERFFPGEMTLEKLRKARACPMCTAEGRDLSGDHYHQRRTNKKCFFYQKQERSGIGSFLEDFVEDEEDDTDVLLDLLVDLLVDPEEPADSSSVAGVFLKKHRC